MWWRTELRRIAALLPILVAGCRDGIAAQQPDATPAPRFAEVRVDTTRRYQVMTGWEATSQSGHDYPFFPSIRDSLFAHAIDRIGINRLRLEVRSGVENRDDNWTRLARNRPDAAGEWRCVRYATVNDNDDPRTIDTAGFHFSQFDHAVENVVLPFRERLARRGERLFLNVTYVAFTGQICGGRQYHHADPEEYAEFVLATHLHLRDRWGIVPDAWEVLLEPDNVEQWNGRLMGQAIVAAARRLRAAGFTTRFIAPSTTDMSSAVRWFDELASVPGAAAELQELAWHRYRGVSERALRELGARARRLGVPGAMLEHIGSGYEALHDDVEYGHAGAWEQYALAYPSGDASSGGDGANYLILDPRAGGQVRIVEGRTVPALRQYFLSIRRGAVRVDASRPEAGVRPLAFVNADGRLAVVTRVDRAGARFSVTGLREGRYAITWATRRGTEGRYDDVTVTAGASLNVVMPEAGVLAIVAR